MYALQLKNMINALFSSKENGTKQFNRGDCTFGWKSITDYISTSWLGRVVVKQEWYRN